MRWVIAVLLRALLLGLIWLTLAGPEADYAVYGLLSVAAATALSLALLPPGPARPRGRARRVGHCLSLAWWFLRQTLVGGVDVALRAVRRTPDIAPEVVVAPLLLPPGQGRQLAMALMNLMPGSMVQQVVDAAGRPADAPDAEATAVELHTLSGELGPAAQWEELQGRVALAVGAEIQPRTQSR